MANSLYTNGLININVFCQVYKLMSRMYITNYILNLLMCIIMLIAKLPDKKLLKNVFSIMIFLIDIN